MRDAPSGWQSVRLGDRVDVGIGGTPSRSNPRYWDANRKTTNRWVAISDLRQRFIRRTAEHISDEGVQNSNVKRVRPGTVLMSFKLTIGRAAIAAEPLYTNEAIAAFIPRDGEVAPEYLFYALPRAALSVEADQAVKGLTLNKAKLLDLLLPLPPLPEQRKIAAILSSVDDTIEQSQAVIDQLEVVKKGLLAEFLTRGMPGQHTEFKETEIGGVPVGWDVVPLEDALEKIIDYRGRTPLKSESGIPLITAKNVRGGFLASEPREYIPAESYNDWMTRGLPQATDILFTTEAPLGNVAPMPSMKVALAQRLLALRPNPTKLDSVFLLWALQHLRSSIEERGTGSTVKGIKQSTLRRLPLPLPSIDEQHRIGPPLQSLQLRIQAEMADLDSLRTVKDALLDALLSGRVRVNVSEKEAA